MKTTLALVLFFSIFSAVPAFAQNNQQGQPITRTFNITVANPTGPTSSPWISERGLGLNNHIIAWTSTGTITTCSVKVQSSEDGLVWADLIAGATCTSPGTGTLTAGNANYVRVNATTITGSGTLIVTYFGFPPGLPSSATLAGDVTSATAANFKAQVSVASGGIASGAIANGASVVEGSTTDAKCVTTDATACSLNALAKAISANTATVAAAVVAQSSPCPILTTASTNSTSCKGSAGNRVGMFVINTTATLYYLRVYNTASAPTCSSATGFIQSFPIPASTTGAGFSVVIPNGGVAFATGLGYCITASSTSTANDNAAAGIFGELYYN